MPRKSPGAKTKGLGTELRRLREVAGVTLKQAGTALGLSPQVISRLETGQRNIAEIEVAGLLALYGVTGPQKDQLLNQARTLDDPGWWELHMPGVTRESATLIDYEDRADRIADWAPLLIPGLLQTMEFGRSVMRQDGVSPAQVEARLSARLRRQHRLTRGDVEYLALIGEPALCGEDEIQRDQLNSLLAAAERPRITIRVVPTRAIPRVARLGAFIAVQSPPVIHVELARSGAFLDEPAFVDPYVTLLDRLAEVALSPPESLRLIAKIRDEMEN